jgi:hypothetical protein
VGTQWVFGLKSSNHYLRYEAYEEAKESVRTEKINSLKESSIWGLMKLPSWSSDVGICSGDMGSKGLRNEICQSPFQRCGASHQIPFPRQISCA